MKVKKKRKAGDEVSEMKDVQFDVNLIKFG